MMKTIMILFVLKLILINALKNHLWNPEDIQNPLTNSDFCNVYFKSELVVCDPESIWTNPIKKILNDFLLHNIPQITPCFCDEGCSTFDYRRRLMIGIVIVSAINENIKDCSISSNSHDCFAEKVLKHWNISLCSGNNGLVLVTNKEIHIYFGAAVHNRIPITCLIRLQSLVRNYNPLHYNLRTIFRRTIQFIRKPCMCNDSCSYRQLKWLTNVVFFMGVIVLVTCIGGMSRRALVAKFHDRPTIRNNIFSNTFRRQRLVGVRAIHIQEHVTEETREEPNPPDYSSLGSLPRPPPYIPSQNTNFPKHNSNIIYNEITEQTCIDQMRNCQMEDQPPAYNLIVREDSVGLISQSTPVNQTQSDINCNNNSVYQS